MHLIVNKVIAVLFFQLAYCPLPAQSIDSLVQSDFNNLKRIFNYQKSIRLLIGDSGQISSIPSGEIYISKRQLSKILSKFERSKQLIAVRFVLAHELAHQTQYLIYSNNESYFNDRPMSQMLLEAQADILSGYMWGYLMASEAYYNKKHNELKREDMYNLFSAIIDLGIDENSLGTHPSKFDRIMLFKEGLIVGITQFLDIFTQKKPKIIKDLFGEIDKIKVAIQQEYSMANFHPEKGEKLTDWSYSLSKQILNFNPILSKDIILDSSTDNVYWNTTEDNPFVNYKLKYTNIGKKSLELNFQVYVSHIKRGYRNQAEYHKRRDRDFYKFVLNPGESRTIQGEIRWDKSSFDLYDSTLLIDEDFPRLVYPGSNQRDAFFSCEQKGDENYYQIPMALKNVQRLSLHKENLKISSLKMAADLIEIIRGFRYNIEDFIIGIGNYKVHPLVGDYIEYNSSVGFGTPYQTKVQRFFNSIKSLDNLNFEKSSIFITANHKIRQDAISNFYQLIEVCDISLKDFKKDDSEQSKYPYNILYSLNSNELIVHVRILNTMDKEKPWAVSLEIAN